MAKTLTETPITTREQRKKLKARPQPYWRAIDPEVHLGYRKAKRGGSWIVRRYLGKGYRHDPVGTADDELREGTLDYNAAVRRAKEIVEQARRDDRAAAEGPVLTVRDAVEAYMQRRDARDSTQKQREVRSDARSRLSRYVTGQEKRGRRKSVEAAPLAEISLHDLSESDLLEWRAALPDFLKGTTKKRLINDLKAALNAGYTDNRSRMPSTLPIVIKHGLRSLDEGDDSELVARENQILADAQVSAVIGAARDVDAEEEWDGDLFRLVVLLAATGARFCQVARLRVADVQIDAGRLMIPLSRKGRRGKSGTVAVRIGADVLEAIKPALVGRARSAILLERPRKTKRIVNGRFQWEIDGRRAWRSASELTRPWALIRDRAGLGEDVVPYALRHSSIVRGIRKQPIRLVAALHDTSVPMIERHYSRFIADLDDLASLSVVPLVPAEPHSSGKVVQIRSA